MISHKVVLSIIKAALNGVPADIDTDFSIDECLQFARSQQIAALLITGLLKSNFTLSEETRKLLYCTAMVSSHQLETFQRLCDVFSKNEIDFMPLKGCVLKYLYPSDEMRSMGDIDILIRVEQYGKIRSLMLMEGYEESIESDHEYHWSSPAAHVELHKRLIPSYNKDYYAYYGDGWQLAKLSDAPYRYEMSHEDTFIYLFTHYAKHYRDAGVGIRQALDLYVYGKAYPDIDKTYVMGKMQKLQLERFYENTMHMLDVWFEGKEHAEASRLIENRLFDSGVFGTSENSLQSTMLKLANARGTVKKAKLVRWVNLFFPPSSGMSKLYPFLKKTPFFLPLMWPVRWVDVILHRHDRIQTCLQENKDVSQESLDAYRDMLHKSGLDFNFK